MSGWGSKSGDSGGISTNVIPIGSTQVPNDTAIPDPTGSYYSEANSVATGVLTDVLTFVVPMTPIWHLLRVEFGGNNIANYSLWFNAVKKDQSFTWFNGNMTGVWDYVNPGGGGVLVASGMIIKVKVVHNRPFVGDFYAKINYIEIN